jgi:hypothetical protein
MNLFYSLDEYQNVGSLQHPTSPQGYTNIAFYPFSGPTVPPDLSLSSPISAIISVSISFTCLHVPPVAPVTTCFHSLFQIPIYPALI